MKRIDVILPFHRIDSFLYKAIDSVGLSSNVRIRLVLVDDRLDQTVDFVLEPKANIDVVFGATKGNQGYGEALRVGTSYLNSDYVALMNSDDVVHKNRFWFQAESIAGNDLNFTALQREHPNGRISKSISGDLKYGEYHSDFLYLGAYGANASWFTTVDWWHTNVYFDNKAALDWRVALSSFNKSRITYIHKPLYIYRRHSLQTTTVLESANELSEVYDLWAHNYKNQFGYIPSKNIFDIMATPWNRTKEIDFYELEKVVSDLVASFSQGKPEISKQSNFLIGRRIAIYLARNPQMVLRLPPRFQGQIPAWFTSLMIDFARR